MFETVPRPAGGRPGREGVVLSLGWCPLSVLNRGTKTGVVCTPLQTSVRLTVFNPPSRTIDLSSPAPWLSRGVRLRGVVSLQVASCSRHDSHSWAGVCVQRSPDLPPRMSVRQVSRLGVRARAVILYPTLASSSDAPTRSFPAVGLPSQTHRYCGCLFGTHVTGI